MNHKHTKQRLWLLPIVLALLMSAQALESQTQRQDTLRISIAQAVSQALQESEEIAAARAMVDQAASQITQATSAALPQLTGNLTYNRAIKTIFDGIDFGMPPGDSAEGGESPFEDLPFGRPNTYMASLQLSQLLFAGGTVGAARRIARHFRNAAEDRYLEAESELTLQVRLAYLNAVAAQSLNEIAIQSRQVSEAHLRQVESFYQAGTSSEFDLLRAQVDLENRDPAVVQTANAAELALLELKRLVNIPADQPVVLTTREGPGMIEVDEDMLAPLVEQRPALNAARENVLMREAAITAYGGQRFPSLRLTGNLGFQGFPSSVTPPGFNDWRQDWWIALGVNWTIFSGLRISGEVAQARAELDQAEAEEAQLQEGLEVALAAAMAEYRMARAQIEARQQTEVLAERALELADARFANGLSTQLEVSDAQLLLDEARVNRVQAMYDYIRALAQLERLSGGRLELLRFP
ncbi:MAG: TolC family protein [Gemmatimonadota bacterium]|nr:MAG: TolC family protein [Gemmatimonadota bacterium]